MPEPIAQSMAEVAKPGEPVVRVLIVETLGSAPREVGASMIVSRGGQGGTIGGGALEFEAAAHARKLLSGRGDLCPAWQRELKAYPLGPALGQCCGGFVRVLFEVLGPREADFLTASGQGSGAILMVRSIGNGEPPTLVANRRDARPWPPPLARIVQAMSSGERPLSVALVPAHNEQPAFVIEPVNKPRLPLYIYGAGHVGRAIVRVLEDLPIAITWVDTARERFPDHIPGHADAVVAPDLTRIADQAAPDSAHLVLTFSHALDLGICHALLKRGDFAYLGLIGSDTKKARFQKRLRAAGIQDSALSRLTCPIGVSHIKGKLPAQIAISVACELIELEQQWHAQGSLVVDDISANAP